MPAKSKHGRGKHPHNRKRSKVSQMQAGTGVTQPAADNISRATAPASTATASPAPIQKRSATSAALPLHYEYISGDLKMIGILTGVVVVILIVLYLFLK